MDFPSIAWESLSFGASWARGKPSLCAKGTEGTFYSKCMLRVEAVHQVDHWLESETFATVNRFHAPRRTERLAELKALSLDLDTYRVPRFRGLPRQAVGWSARM